MDFWQFMYSIYSLYSVEHTYSLYSLYSVEYMYSGEYGRDKVKL